MSHCIYGLFDPREPELIRYIGFTKYTPDYRLHQHVAEAKQNKLNHRCNWIRSVLVDGVKPQSVLIELVTLENWKDREKFWIGEYAASLTNTTEGGEGLVNPSQEVRDRIAAKCKILSTGNQYRLGISHTDESRAAIREGMKNSAKVRAAFEAKKGINPHSSMTDDQKRIKSERLRASKLGKKRAPFSDETKRKMSKSMTGKKLPSASAKKLGRKSITDGSTVKMLDQNAPLPEGWRYGNLQNGIKKPRS